EVSELDLRLASRPAGSPAGALAVDIAWPHGAIPLLAVNHKPSRRPDAEDEREAQVVAAVRFVSQIVERTRQSVLLGGDFIAAPHGAIPPRPANPVPARRHDAEARREAQAVAAGRFVTQSVARTGQSVLLGGDLDAEPDPPSDRFWSESYADVWRQCNGADP